MIPKTGYTILGCFQTYRNNENNPGRKSLRSARNINGASEHFKRRSIRTLFNYDFFNLKTIFYAFFPVDFLYILPRLLQSIQKTLLFKMSSVRSFKSHFEARKYGSKSLKIFSVCAIFYLTLTHTFWLEIAIWMIGPGSFCRERFFLLTETSWIEFERT